MKTPTQTPWYNHIDGQLRFPKARFLTTYYWNFMWDKIQGVTR